MTNLAPTSPSGARHPYSPVRATEAGLVYVSGQLGIADGDIVEGGIVPETRQALANLQSRLASAGLELRHLVKITVYLASMDDRNAMDRSIRRPSSSPCRPAHASPAPNCPTRPGSSSTPSPSGTGPECPTPS
ncbi:RidA family protein [Streptomyces phaeochromogenes]|uniref:RidA family protein n=1 Tax=Streptomyces phaeochromogenes TaxID=1923 RepID=UPI00099E2F2B|nr:RidA family protein [Streptomyces phaeochromogenes]